MQSRGAIRGSLQLWRHVSGQVQQARCVGDASRIFPDPSSLQGDSHPSERGEFGQVSGAPVEILSRVVSIPALFSRSKFLD